MEIVKPTADDLRENVLSVGAPDGDIEGWTARVLTGLSSLLSRSPLRYREFGPYWWGIKKAFINRGDMSFGAGLDKEWLDACDYGDDALNLAVAWAYADSRFRHTAITDTHHQMDGVDGEPVDYVIDDQDMEVRGWAM